MDKTFQLDIVTPTEIINKGQVEYLRAPSIEGLFGIKAGHATSTIVVDIGEIKITKEGKEYYYATNGGFADIRPESVMLIVETLEESTAIDKKRAEAALKRAQDRLKGNDIDFSQLERSIVKSRNRLNILKRIK